MTCEIELVGSDHKLRETSRGMGVLSGEALCLAHGYILKDDGGWQYKTDGKRLVIEGWKDPKTGKFHGVKSITFKSMELPKDLMPKVTMPSSKKA